MDTAALRDLPIVRPDRDSITQFAPFVDVDATTWMALLDECDRLRANLRAATDLVQRAEKMIPGFARTWTPMILGDTAEARDRAEAAEALAARYEQALRELLDSVGVVLDDDRLGYIEVQLDPDALATARAALAAGSGEERDE